MKRTQYDEHMDALTTKIVAVCDGHPLYEVACAASVVAAFSIVRQYPNLDEREEAYQLLTKMMNRIIYNAPSDDDDE